MAGTPLTALQIGSSYAGLLKTTDNAVFSGVLRTITDGMGNDSALQVSTTGVKSTGTFAVDGATTLTGAVSAPGGVTGNLSGNASTVTTNANLTGDVTSVGNATTLGTVPVAKGGTGGTTKALAQAGLGILQSNLESSSSGILAGSSGVDLVYAGGPSVSITAGTWLLWGACPMRTNDSLGEFQLGFRNTTDSADFGKGAWMKNNDLNVIHPMTCFGYVTVAGTKTINLKGFVSGSHTLEMGTVAGGGVIRAIQLTN